MQIYLAKPGSQRQGPFSLEQINRDLAAGKYKDSDFWAWHEGLPSWIPLYSIPGVSAATAAPIAAQAAPPKPQAPSVQSAAAAPSAAQPAKPQTPAFQSAPSPAAQPQPAKPQTPAIQSNPPIVVRPAPAPPKPQASPAQPTASSAAAPPLAKPQGYPFQSAPSPAARPQPVKPQVPPIQSAAPATTGPKAPKPPPPSAQFGLSPAARPEPAKPQVPAIPKVASGFPFSCLEQVFIFTTDEAESVFDSQITIGVLEAAIDAPLEQIREQAPIDIIAGSDVGVQMMHGGSIPEAAWQGMSLLKPTLAEDAQDGLYDVYLHPFPIEGSQVVAIFLFYGKQRKRVDQA